MRLDRPVASVVAKARAQDLRSIVETKAVAHRAGRAGQVADVVVLGGLSRRGLTEDYLEVDLDDQSLGRGERVDLILEMRAGRLKAVARAPARSW